MLKLAKYIWQSRLARLIILNLLFWALDAAAILAFSLAWAMERPRDEGLLQRSTEIDSLAETIKKIGHTLGVECPSPAPGESPQDCIKRWIKTADVISVAGDQVGDMKARSEAFLVDVAAWILRERNVSRAMVVSRKDNNSMWSMSDKLEDIADRMRSGYP